MGRQAWAIKAHLFTPVVVASTFLLGGLIIVWAEKRQKFGNNAPDSGVANAVGAGLSERSARINSVDEMTALDALKVGLAQCLAMVPGTSRSGPTSIGGMLLGLSRKAATDFFVLPGDL